MPPICQVGIQTVEFSRVYIDRLMRWEHVQIQIITVSGRYGEGAALNSHDLEPSHSLKGDKQISRALSFVAWELTFGLRYIILGFMKFPGCSRGSRNSGTLCLVSCSARRDPVVFALFRNRLVLLWHGPFVSTERDRETHNVWVPYLALFMFLK